MQSTSGSARANSKFKMIEGPADDPQLNACKCCAVSASDHVSDSLAESFLEVQLPVLLARHHPRRVKLPPCRADREVVDPIRRRPVAGISCVGVVCTTSTSGGMNMMHRLMMHRRIVRDACGPHV